jgi:hypothetical protein
MVHHRDYPFAASSSSEAVKVQAYGYLNAIHYLAPHKRHQPMPEAKCGCKALCLGWFSGQAGMVASDAQINNVRQSRLDKTRRFVCDRKAYLADIVRQIERQQRLADKRGFKPCVRPNGASDIAWEGIRLADGKNLFERLPDVEFVDYTKIARRFERKLPRNYHLTLSRSEANEAECLAALETRDQRRDRVRAQASSMAWLGGRTGMSALVQRFRSSVHIGRDSGAPSEARRARNP